MLAVLGPAAGGRSSRDVLVRLPVTFAPEEAGGVGMAAPLLSIGTGEADEALVPFYVKMRSNNHLYFEKVLHSLSFFVIYHHSFLTS